MNTPPLLCLLLLYPLHDVLEVLLTLTVKTSQNVCSFLLFFSLKLQYKVLQHITHCTIKTLILLKTRCHIVSHASMCVIRMSL